MKRTLITSLLASALLFGGGCSDDFDDSALWKGVDEIYNQLTELEKQADQLNDQIRLLSSIVNGGAITSITQDAEGNDVIRFKGADNIEHSVTVATKDDVSSAPILGTKEENGVLYWTTTVDGNTDFLKDTDGSKIPVAGRTPEMAVDKEGYWTLNGRRLTDASGNPVKAEGKQTSSSRWATDRPYPHRYSTPSTSSSRSATPPSTTSTPSKTFRSHSRSVTRSRAKRPTKRS